jgi:hypothetical protein
MILEELGLLSESQNCPGLPNCVTDPSDMQYYATPA